MSKRSRIVKADKGNRKRLHKLETIQQVSARGKIFSVSFTKKDGTERTMACRLGVTKHLRGGNNTVRHLPEYLTVFSINDKGYRNVNLNTLKEVKGQGKTFKF